MYFSRAFLENLVSASHCTDWSCQGQGISGQDTQLHGWPYDCSHVAGELGGVSRVSGEGVSRVSGEGVSRVSGEE